MEREELINYLRENLRISIEMDDSYECENRYVSATVTLSLAGEEISSEYDSIGVGSG